VLLQILLASISTPIAFTGVQMPKVVWKLALVEIPVEMVWDLVGSAIQGERIEGDDLIALLTVLRVVLLVLRVVLIVLHRSEQLRFLLDALGSVARRLVWTKLTDVGVFVRRRRGGCGAIALHGG